MTLAWLTRYPLHNKITVDRGKELLAEFTNMMANDYGILCDSLVHETHKQTQLWQGYTKLLVILYVPLKFNKCI